eukprot:1159203-Pelagomonas_calceolata.AAC.9
MFFPVLDPPKRKQRLVDWVKNFSFPQMPRTKEIGAASDHAYFRGLGTKSCRASIPHLHQTEKICCGGREPVHQHLGCSAI